MPGDCVRDSILPSPGQREGSFSYLDAASIQRFTAIQAKAVFLLERSAEVQQHPALNWEDLSQRCVFLPSQQRHPVPVPRSDRHHPTALREHGVSAKWCQLPRPPSYSCSVSPAPNSDPRRGEQCGGCRRSSATDRPHSFQVILTDRPSLELSAENEEEMADWMQYLCQAVSKGVSGQRASLGLGLWGTTGSVQLTCCLVTGRLKHVRAGGRELGLAPAGPLVLRSSEGRLALLPTQVIPQGVAPAPCVPCCLVVTEQKVFTCHEDCQTSFFRSLATAELAEVASISTEPGREYCLLVSLGGGRRRRLTQRAPLGQRGFLRAPPGLGLAWLSFLSNSKGSWRLRRPGSHPVFFSPLLGVCPGPEAVPPPVDPLLQLPWRTGALPLGVGCCVEECLPGWLVLAVLAVRVPRGHVPSRSPAHPHGPFRPSVSAGGSSAQADRGQLHQKEMRGRSGLDPQHVAAQ